MGRKKEDGLMRDNERERERDKLKKKTKERDREGIKTIKI